MKFDPLSDEQIQQWSLVLAAGPATFEVVGAEEKTSKSSGDAMLELTLKVWDQHGREGQVFDYLTASSKMQWKLKNLCKSIGQLELYAQGDISAFHLTGKTGACELRIETDPKYGARAKIKDYRAITAETATASVAQADDDVPF